jgi:hypothetical protein
MPSAIEVMNENMGQVDDLLRIHSAIHARNRTRLDRDNLEVLNKSAIVLITACWESLIEDLAREGFGQMVSTAPTHAVIPPRVLVLASKDLRDDSDKRAIWELAGNGWREVLQRHRQVVLDDFIGGFHSPRPEKVDELFDRLLGLPRVTETWTWTHMTPQRARKKLTDYLALRGQIAHRVGASSRTTKRMVEEYRSFAFRLAVKTSNSLNDHLESILGVPPWPKWAFGGVK